jgi:hypothetical protein
MTRLDLSLSSAHLFPLQSVLIPPCGLHGGNSNDDRALVVTVMGGGVNITRRC